MPASTSYSFGIVAHAWGMQLWLISIYLTADKYTLFDVADNPVFTKYATYVQSVAWLLLSRSLIPDGFQTV